MIGLLKNYSESIPLYLGGSHHGDHTSCFILSDGILTQDHLLKCDHQLSDDRIILNVNHAVKVDKFSDVVIASSNIDVFACALYHFSRWIYSELHELRSSHQRCFQRTGVLRNFLKFTRKHLCQSLFFNKVVDVLPAVHALTGYDKASKTGTKFTAFEAVMKCDYKLLYSFGKSKISDQMILSA